MGYLGKEERETTIGHFFNAEIIKGEPTLGGEELERNQSDNHYKVVLVNINDIDKINILGLGKKLIKECLEEYKKN